MSEHAHHPEPEIQSPNQPKSFLAFLAEQQGGVVANELSKELRELTEAIEDHFDHYRGKVSGSIGVSLKLTLEGGIYRVDCEYAVRRPKVPVASTIMWLGNDGNLATNNPKQLNLPFQLVKGE
jgi:hypothetical protein